MKNKTEKLSLEKKAAIKAAENEAQFNAQSILEELTPLIKDYFIAETESNGKEINISFLNGQKFRICAEEISNV